MSRIQYLLREEVHKWLLSISLEDLQFLFNTVRLQGPSLPGRLGLSEQPVCQNSTKTDCRRVIEARTSPTASAPVRKASIVPSSESQQFPTIRVPTPAVGARVTTRSSSCARGLASPCTTTTAGCPGEWASPRCCGGR